MAACGGKFKFDFDDDEKLSSVMSRRAADSGTWNSKNKPQSSTGKVIRLKRSSVRGIVLANEGGDMPVISSPRVVSEKQMIAESYYDSVASKTGDGALGFHLKDSLTGIVQVTFSGSGKVGTEAVPMITNLQARPKAVTEMQKKPKLVPGTWMQTARPRSPYISEGILYAELESGSGYGQRAIVIPKGAEPKETTKLMLEDVSSFFSYSTGNKAENAVLEDCIKRSTVIEYMDRKWVDVWVGGNPKNMLAEVKSKGAREVEVQAQEWGVRIGNWWFMQQGQDKTNIAKMSASKCKKTMQNWKRVGCTTCRPEWIQNEFLPTYTEKKPEYHLEKHNHMHIAAAIVCGLGLETPFWAKPGAVAKGCVKSLKFSKTPRGGFKSVKAVRMF